MRIKTIDVNAKEWFDKQNGNSYFSAVVTLNYGMKNVKTFEMPFQYGYGDHYVDMAGKLLAENGTLDLKKQAHGGYEALWSYCKENKIILRTSKQENCKKQELIA